MKKSKTVFIGELPPPYGGVAVKDEIMYNEVYHQRGVLFLDLVECKRNPWKTPMIGLRLLWQLITADRVVVGVGSYFRMKFIISVRKFFRGNNGLSTVYMLAMGGNIQNVIKTDARLRNCLVKCGSVWVETEGMMQSLREQGFQNVKFFPNCRTDRNSLPPREVGAEMRYVFFSRICKEKGVDDVFEALEHSNGGFTVDFYGKIADAYKERFQHLIKDHPEVTYHGVFDAVNGNVYQELNQYDAILLPSRWSGEGVPGALVESKMAGIAAIVSDWNFNAEIVKDGIEGVVFKDDLKKVLNEMTPEKLMLLKNGAFKSRVRYDIATYREALLAEISGETDN